MNKTDTSQVATKEDINKLQDATRADIQRLEQSTKKDIDRLEESLKKFATKSELKRVEKSLRSEILRVEERVENVDESQKRMETILNKISVQLDGFVGTVDDLRTDNEVGAHHTRELQLQVKEHGKRITRLESPNTRTPL